MKKKYAKSAVEAKSMEVVFKTYHKRLCHFAWQMLGDRGMVDDVVQDAFVAYWNQRHVIYDNEVAIKNFLYAAVRHACMNLFRHAKIVRRYEEAHPDEAFEESKVMHNIIRAEVMDEVLKVMQTLPEGCKAVFRLGYLEGLSNPEVADQLNISVNTVKTQKQRAMTALRTKLNPEFFAVIALLGLGA